MGNNLKPSMRDRVRLAGALEERFHKWYPRELRVVGGYNITHTPDEICMIIQDLRGQRQFPSMLCYGASTGGNERILAENIGCMAVSFINPVPGFERQLQDNTDGMERQGIRVRKGSVSGKPDLITFSGEDAEADFETSIPFLMEKMNVVVFGCQDRYMCDGSKRLFRKLRKGNDTIVLTMDNGIGVLRIRLQSIPGEEGRRRDALQKQETGKMDVQEQTGNGEGVGQGNPVDQEASGRDSEAPCGRKKDGSPKQRPGRPVVVAA